MPSQNNLHKWCPRPQTSHKHGTHTHYSPAGRSYLPVKPQQRDTFIFTGVWGRCSKYRDSKRVPGHCQHPRRLSRVSYDQRPHLGEDVGALLQQRHGGLSQTGGQLDPQQLLLLGEVVLQGVSQGDGGAPVGQRVGGKEASAQQLPRWDGICCEEGIMVKTSGHFIRVDLDKDASALSW